MDGLNRTVKELNERLLQTNTELESLRKQCDTTRQESLRVTSLNQQLQQSLADAEKDKEEVRRLAQARVEKVTQDYERLVQRTVDQGQ
jgi:regulator of replication initiation timing